MDQRTGPLLSPDPTSIHLHGMGSKSRGVWTHKLSVVMMPTFFIVGGTGGCHFDNLCCDQPLQSWHHDDSQFSVSISR